MKIALLVAYDGTALSGFARQPGRRTVQGEIEAALERLLRAPVAITGAGRTDAGVHASGQVVSFATPASSDPAWILRRVNRLLAPEISVRAAAEVPDSFDARFSARSRAYEYRLYRDPSPDPLLDRFALHAPWPLDLRAMRAGARALVGEHDFSAFSRASGRSPVRRVRSITVSAPERGRLVLRVIADSFRHQMVRSIAGTLLEVGRGRRAASDVVKALASRDRSFAGPVAPAKALHLVAVRYARDPFGRVARFPGPAQSGRLTRARGHGRLHPR